MFKWIRKPTYLILMTAASLQRPSRRGIISGFVIAMMLSVPLVSIDRGMEKNSLKDGIGIKMNTQEESDSTWIDGGQPCLSRVEQQLG
ncbi:MAG: hypothetical protein Ct9H90mP24_5690 [Methanobacteriota archaeon]|nr:MAG: hypothetical protein Ct9H90mP24_5690 [Euryarchaeota archaeon]